MPRYTFPVEVVIDRDLSRGADAQEVAAAIEEALEEYLTDKYGDVRIIAGQPGLGRVRHMSCDGDMT